MRAWLLRQPRGRLLWGGWVLWVIVNAVLISLRQSPRVLVESLKRQPMDLIVRVPGNLEPRKSAIVKAAFEGAVLKKTFREGQAVHQGDLLVELDPKKIRLAYQGKQDALSNARTELDHARRALRINQLLFKRQAIAYSTVEDAQRASVRATQALRAAEDDFALEKERWATARQRALFDGTIVKDGIGDLSEVTSGQELYILADISGYTVKARVDELDIKQVREGQMAEVRVQIYPDRVFAARVLQVGSTPDTPGLASIPVTLQLQDPKGVLLRPRLTADVRILTGKTEPVLSVPLSSLVPTESGMGVWSLGWMNRLRSLAVETGRSNPDRIEVTSGLRPGRQIVVNAEANFQSGLRVIRGTPRARPPVTSEENSGELFPGGGRRPGAPAIKPRRSVS